jgi:hypothetical protein
MEAFWDDIENRFFRLHKEQESENGFLYALNDGDAWTVGGGTKNSKKQFEWLAERAALRLGVPPGGDQLFFWLDRLKKESPRYKRLDGTIDRRKSELDSDEMCSLERDFSHSEGGIIELLCKASAEYCIRCSTQAPATASGPTPPNLKPVLTKREEKIWGVIQANSKGAQYCRELHNANLKPRRSWIEQGCPGTYPAAANDRKWLQRIQDEKSKVRRKAELTFR